MRGYRLGCCSGVQGRTIAARRSPGYKGQREKFLTVVCNLLKHLDGIVNYCRTKVRMGVVEAVNGNIRMLINRGRGYKNLRYLLLKAKRLAVSNLELIVVRRIGKPA